MNERDLEQVIVHVYGAFVSLALAMDDPTRAVRSLNDYADSLSVHEEQDRKSAAFLRGLASQISERIRTE